MKQMNKKKEPRDVLRDRFFDGMSLVASTVNIVTTDGPAGRYGVTVSAMSSVSADTKKPTLLVCINERSPAAKAILENEAFCVNILRDDQSYISDTFAGRYKDQLADKFDCANWETSGTGSPQVIDALAAFDCTVKSIEKVGTHFVIFGYVQDVQIAKSGSPLIYYNRAYRSSAAIDATPWTPGKSTTKEKLSVGCFHTFGPFLMPRLIREMVSGSDPVNIDLVEGDHIRVGQALRAGEIELALMYKYGADDEFDHTLLTELCPYVLLPEGHELAQYAELTPEIIAGYPMVSVSENTTSTFLENIFHSRGLKPNVVFRSSSFEMVRGLVGHGLGFAIMMTKPVETMTYDGMPLVTRKLKIDISANAVVLAWRKGEALSRQAKPFYRRCVEMFGAEPTQS